MNEIDELLAFFEYDHLPQHLQEVSRPICILAHRLADEHAHNGQLKLGLQLLLQAKDALVRSAL